MSGAVSPFRTAQPLSEKSGRLLSRLCVKSWRVTVIFSTNLVLIQVVLPVVIWIPVGTDSFSSSFQYFKDRLFGATGLPLFKPSQLPLM